MYGGDIFLINGFWDVIWDYLKVWEGYSEQFECIKEEEIFVFNMLVGEVGVLMLRIF